MKNLSTTLTEKIRENQEYSMLAQEGAHPDVDYRIMLECQCQTEFLGFEENIYEDGEVEIQTAFWHGSLSIKMTLLQRLYAAYRIMRVGRALMYDFRFTPADMFRLRDWLNAKYPVDNNVKK